MPPRSQAGSALPVRAAHFALLAHLALAAAHPAHAAHAAGEAGTRAERPTLAILDPVDMASQSVRPSLGDRLRVMLSGTRRFVVLGRDEQEAKLKEYSFDPGAPCAEFQCGFDRGSALQADYVLVGTATDLGRLYSYTFNLVHMGTSQVVLSEVGEVARRNDGDPAAALMARLEKTLGEVEPDRLSRAVQPKQGLMAVLDLSESTPHSRAMAERVQTHAYASRRFDLMSRVELDDLMQALGIDKSGITPTDANILPIGDRLGVSHLVFSRLAVTGPPDDPAYRLHLALYDVQARRKLREWPARSGDFRKLLQFEDRFFTTLTEDGPLFPTAKAEGRGPGPWRIGLALAGLAAGGTLGWMAWEARQEAEAEYALAKGAMGSEAVAAHRERIEEGDRLTLIYGGLGAACLGFSLALVTF